MKKVLLPVFLGATCITPVSVMADTTLYGKLQYSLNSVDEDRANIEGNKDGIIGADNVSLFGLKGSYGDDIKAFFHLQTGAPADGNSGRAFNQRFFFGGLSGGFGKVAYGRMTNAYKFPGFKLDPFYNLSHVSTAGRFAAGGATYGLSPATNGFTNNALQYVTPSFGGFTVTGGLYVDDSNDDEHGYLAGGEYKNGGIHGGVVYATNGDNGTESNPVVNVDDDGDAIRVYGTYSAESWKLAGSYEQVDTGGTDPGYLYLTGTYNLPDWDLSVSFGLVDDGPAEGNGITAGAFYHIAPKTRVFGLVSYASLDNIDSDPLVFSIGASHSFSLGGES